VGGLGPGPPVPRLNPALANGNVVIWRGVTFDVLGRYDLVDVNNYHCVQARRCLLCSSCKAYRRQVVFVFSPQQ